MLHLLRGDRPWFRAKRRGYGTGLPIAWQGWVVLAAYLVVTFSAATQVPRHPLVAIVLIAVATAVLIVLSAQHTRGGWKWRWGGEE